MDKILSVSQRMVPVRSYSFAWYDSCFQITVWVRHVDGRVVVTPASVEGYVGGLLAPHIDGAHVSIEEFRQALRAVGLSFSDVARDLGVDSPVSEGHR